MNDRQEENEIWVENLWEGTFLLKIEGDRLLGYLIKCDPCNVTEDDGPYEEGLIPTFDEYSKKLGLEAKRVGCVFRLFENSKSAGVNK